MVGWVKRWVKDKADFLKTSFICQGFQSKTRKYLQTKGINFSHFSFMNLFLFELLWFHIFTVIFFQTCCVTDEYQKDFFFIVGRLNLLPPPHISPFEWFFFIPSLYKGQDFTGNYRFGTCGKYYARFPRKLQRI